MAGVVSFPHHEPWMVSNRSFRMLLERTAAKLSSDGDKADVIRAIHMHGLMLELKEHDQAVRIALAMGIAADELRVELQRQKQDLRTEELIEKLAVLEMLLHDIHE